MDIHTQCSFEASSGGCSSGFQGRVLRTYPGRLLHARCFSQDQHLDFICLYQHALPFMMKRKQLWNKVDGLLRSLPLRSSVALAGDFNSNLCTSAPCIGHSVLHNKVKPAVAEERRWLTGMLVSHQLAALNSWSRRLHTYSHPSGVSQIDWILVRAPIADSIARQCAPQEAPIAGWRSSGHPILQASIPLLWRPWKLKAQSQRRQAGPRLHVFLPFCFLLCACVFLYCFLSFFRVFFSFCLCFFLSFSLFLCLSLA